MKQTLKQAVQQHYEDQQLDIAQLEQLEAIYSKITPNEEHSQVATPEVSIAKTTKPRQQNLFFRYRYGLAAGLLIAFLMVVSLVTSPFWMSQEQQIMAIASEVAKEHLHQNPLEVSSNDFSKIQRYFNKLDFLPSASRHFGSKNTLLGGRYCSIRNVTAAQIRYNFPQHPATLYQVVYDPAYFGQIPDVDRGEIPLTRYVRGVQVQVWVEKGLLMVAAQNTSTSF